MSKTEFLERMSPESQGIASAAIQAFVDGVNAQHLGLHSLMLLRHGKVVAEGWWRPFTADEPHILYSLTKSFTSTAAGLAMAEGRFGLDDPVLSFFPRDAPREPSAHWRELRVRHLLSMATGHEVEPWRDLDGRSPREWLRYLLRSELKYAPGAHFLYNSLASHIVSLIVQKVTGQKLVNYLRDRLFKPLGIPRPHWETDPLGHNWGGWGLFLRTEEIARFGQMVHDCGRWQGQQLVPAAWLEQATSKQISNGNDPNSDWAQGYGFQYWMSRHGFRGDGAFGQFCCVLRDQKLLLVTTASTPNMQAILDVAWQTLLPGLSDGPLPEDAAADRELKARLANLQVDGPAGEPSSPSEAEFLGRTYALDANPLGWQALCLTREGGEILLSLTTGAGEQVIRCGMAGWTRQQLALDFPTTLPVAATARWAGGNDLGAALVYLNPAATRHITLGFTGSAVECHTRLTGTFAPPDEIAIAGRQ